MSQEPTSLPEPRPQEPNLIEPPAPAPGPENASGGVPIEVQPAPGEGVTEEQQEEAGL